MATSPDLPDADSGSFPRGPGGADETLKEAADSLVFRRYRVIRKLGQGGMGIVLLAQDTALEIPVAVKLIPDLVVQDVEAIADLRKEVLRGMALAHPGIVRTNNFEKDESGAGIVMEYVDGDTLTGLKCAQPGGCFNPAEILPWLEQICAVLEYAHRDARIVHRDLKPRNIMLNSAGRIKIADFGIAAVLTDSMSRHSMEGKISGTLSYMSPQQAEGKRPSPLDDIHALGATIYELLTGKPPFFRGNPATIMVQIMSVTPPSLAERRADLEVHTKEPLPEVWEDVIAACLAKDPAQRPQSAAEVLARLKTTPAVAPRIPVIAPPRPEEVTQPAPPNPSVPPPATPSAAYRSLPPPREPAAPPAIPASAAVAVAAPPVRAGRGLVWLWLALPILGLLGGGAGWWAFQANAQRVVVTRAQSNVRQLALSLRLYAADHDGRYPPTLRDLSPDYLPDPRLLECPLPALDASPRADGQPASWWLYRGGTDTDAGDKMVLVSPYTTRDGKRIVVYNDGRTELVPAARAKLGLLAESNAVPATPSPRSSTPAPTPASTPVPSTPLPATPMPSAGITPQKLRAFCEEMQVAEESHDVERILTFYAPKVDYLEEGIVGHAAIRGDKQRYFQRWPKTPSSLRGEITILESSPDRWKLRYEVNFGAENAAGNRVTGVAECTLEVVLMNGALKIVHERGRTISRNGQLIENKKR